MLSVRLVWPMKELPFGERPCSDTVTCHEVAGVVQSLSENDCLLKQDMGKGCSGSEGGAADCRPCCSKCRSTSLCVAGRAVAPHNMEAGESAVLLEHMHVVERMLRAASNKCRLRGPGEDHVASVPGTSLCVAGPTMAPRSRQAGGSTV